MRTESTKIFVAYASRDEEVSSIVFDAVRRANSLPLPNKFEPWPFNDVSGRPLVNPILENIDEAPYVVADITYFNLNVVYEIGFAIGRKKRVLLIRHGTTEGDRAIAQKTGIFDTLGYSEYQNVDDLRDLLAAHFDPTPLQVNHKLDKKSPVYIIEPSQSRHADLIIKSRIKKAGFRFRSFNPVEHTRMSSTETLRQIAASSGVVCRLQETDIRGGDIHNIRAMFAIGIGDGMAKPTLVLCPPEFIAPLDIRDSVRPYRRPEEIGDAIADFCPAVVQHLTEQEPPLFENLSPLSSLSIGDPMAENEMTTLARYYLATDQFQRVMNGDANLVVGRKGSGKTALFIRVRDKIRSDKRNIVVDLKPEGYQLLKFKEDVLAYLSAGARQHLITAFWEYLLLVEIANKLLEKDRQTYKQNHLIHEHYVALRDICERNSKNLSEGDFSERLYVLSEDIVERFKDEFGGAEHVQLTTDEVMQLLHTQDIPDLRDAISSYLDRKESVWILFDNLDKGWSIGGVDETDALMVRALIDASRKVERELERDGHRVQNVIFIRNDVYDSVMRNSSDFGKEMRAVLDWTDPDLLREMLRLRLLSGLDITAANPTFYDLWQQLSVSHFMGEESSAVLIDRTLMRPRNLLKIFNHCRGFATNLGKSRIEGEDIEKGLRAYSEDLFTEITRELEDVIPIASDVLYEFMDAPAVLVSEDVRARLQTLAASNEDQEKILRFLIFYGVLGLKLEDRTIYIYHVNYDLKRIEVRVRNVGADARFQINPALWPVLNCFEVSEQVGPITDIESFIDDVTGQDLQ